jgi:CheY-like chemotaxis protein
MIIGLTAYEDHETQCLAGGMNGFTTKPVERATLIGIIAEQIRKRQGREWSPHLLGCFTLSLVFECFRRVLAPHASGSIRPKRSGRLKKRVVDVGVVAATPLVINPRKLPSLALTGGAGLQVRVVQSLQS